jgi:hypothetical protein
MWVASILQVLALGVVDPPAPLAASATPAPIYWRQTRFSIPFHVSRPDRPGQEPVQVQLFVSGDRGGRWDNWLQATPDKGQFVFRAGCDGEYWFDVRTLDRSGQVRPQGPHSPNLIVIVDTVPPKVQLMAARGDAGQVTTTFRIDESYPKLDTLTIDYRTEPTTAWQTVPVGPKDVRSNSTEHRGEVTWYPQLNTATMEVRLRVGDLAGNPAESHARVASAAGGNATTANTAGPPATAIAANTTSANHPNPQALVAAASTPSPSNSPTPPTASVPVTTPSPAAVKTAEPLQPLGSPTSRTPWPAENAVASAGPTAPEAAVNDNGSIAIRSNPMVTQQFVVGLGATPKTAINPFTAFTAARPAGPVASATQADSAEPPPGVQPRWINKRVFQMTFDARQAGGSGNLPVELWGTRDGGKSWRTFGRDPKGQSPMLVTVPEDGVYGFRMSIESRPDMAGRPPLPGDKPGTWIGVDLTRPTGRITQAQQGAGREGDKLFVAWEASDNHELAARPISLSYSERLGGPWTTMATDLENNGRYAWQLTGSLPQRMYLRLEIHDAAGNMGIYETPEPVMLDLSSPAAQLRDLRPLGRLTPPPAEERSYLR